jgi:hypothetical protein
MAAAPHGASKLALTRVAERGADVACARAAPTTVSAARWMSSILISRSEPCFVNCFVSSSRGGSGPGPDIACGDRFGESLVGVGGGPGKSPP